MSHSYTAKKKKISAPSDLSLMTIASRFFHEADDFPHSMQEVRCQAFSIFGALMLNKQQQSQLSCLALAAMLTVCSDAWEPLAFSVSFQPWDHQQLR